MVRQPINLGSLGRLQGPGKQVTARPSDTFFQPTGEVEKATVLNLAPLSATLTDFLAKKQAEKGREGALAGKKFALENQAQMDELETNAAKLSDPTARRDFLKKEFAKLQAAGKIKAGADPFFQIGYARASARSAIGDYQRAVQGRLDEAAQTGEPADVEGILSEEWALHADKPSITNTYGQEVALAGKQGVDEDFRTKAAKARADRMEQEFTEIFTGEISQKVEGVLASKGKVSALDMMDITQFITDEGKAHNVQDLRGLVAQAAQLSIERAKSLGGDEMARTVGAWQDLVVGNQKLGDDATGVGARFEKLQQEAERISEDDAADENRQRKLARENSLLAAEELALGPLFEAHQRGENVNVVRDQLAAQIDANPESYGGPAGAARAKKHVFEMAEAQADVSITNPEVSDDFNFAMAGRDFETADTVLRAALANKEIDSETYRSMRDQLRSEADTVPFLERNPTFQGAVSRLRSLRMTGFSGSAQSELADLEFRAEDQLIKGATDVIRAAQEAGEDESAAVNEYFRSEGPKAYAELRQAQEVKRQEGREVKSAVSKMTARQQDASEELELAWENGQIDDEQLAVLSQANVRAAQNFSTWENLPLNNDVQRELRNFIELQAEESGAAPEATLKLSSELQLKWQRDWRSMMNGVRDDATVSPGNFGTEIQSRGEELRRTFLDESFPGDRERIERQLTEGKSAEQAERIEVQEDKRRASGLALFHGDLSLEALGVTPDPALGSSVYEMAMSYQRQEDPFFRSPITRDDAEKEAWIEMARVPEGQRQAATESLLPLIGTTPEQVLNEVRAWEPNAESIQERLEHLERAKSGQFGKRRAGVQSKIDRIMAERSLEVSMEGGTYRPFTTPFFQTVKELDRWQDSSEWGAFLTRIGLDPKDEDDVLEFVAQQHNIIDRLTP